MGGKIPVDWTSGFWLLILLLAMPLMAQGGQGDMALRITAPGSLPPAMELEQYQQGQPFQATGGIGVYTYSIKSGTTQLPAGMTLSKDPATQQWSIKGAPQPGSANYPGNPRSVTVYVTDSSSPPKTGEKTYKLTIFAAGAPLITAPAALPDATQGQPYSQPLTISGGTGSCIVTVDPGTPLPAGLGLSSTPGGWMLTGTPNGSTPASGVPVKLIVEDSSVPKKRSFRDYTLVVISSTNPEITAPNMLSDAMETKDYQTVVFTIEGGTSPYTISAETPLPNGMEIKLGTSGNYNGKWILHGEPADGTATTPGNPLHLVLKVEDTGGKSSTREYDWVIHKKITLSPELYFPPAMEGVEYLQPLAISGGTAPYNVNDMYEKPKEGDPEPLAHLPFGLKVLFSAQSGVWVITGIPQPGSATPGSNQLFRLHINDSKGFHEYPERRIVVYPGGVTLTPDRVAAVEGEPYNPLGLTTFTVSGAPGPYVFTSAENLPAGMNLTEAGVLEGTPAAGTSANSPYEVAVHFRVSPPEGDITITTQVTIAVVFEALTLITKVLPEAGELASYPSFPLDRLEILGGTAPYTITYVSGLPPGMRCRDGIISGTPYCGAAEAGTYPVALEITDSTDPAFARIATCDLPVIGLFLAIDTASLPQAQETQAYDCPLAASGVVARITSWTSPNLPKGFVVGNFEGAWRIKGTPYPGSAGGYAVTLTVTEEDSFESNSTSVTLPLNIVAMENTSDLHILTTYLPEGTEGARYPATALKASGGSGSFIFEVHGLPAGLALNGDNGSYWIGGTPEIGSSGQHAVVFVVTDAVSGESISTALPLVVQAAGGLDGEAGNRSQDAYNAALVGAGAAGCSIRSPSNHGGLMGLFTLASLLVLMLVAKRTSSLSQMAATGMAALAIIVIVVAWEDASIRGQVVRLPDGSERKVRFVSAQAKPHPVIFRTASGDGADAPSGRLLLRMPAANNNPLPDDSPPPAEEGTEPAEPSDPGVGDEDAPTFFDEAPQGKDIVLILDISSSMAVCDGETPIEDSKGDVVSTPSRIDIVRTETLNLLRALGDDCGVAIVAFGGNVNHWSGQIDPPLLTICDNGGAEPFIPLKNEGRNHVIERTMAALATLRLGTPSYTALCHACAAYKEATDMYYLTDGAPTACDTPDWKRTSWDFSHAQEQILKAFPRWFEPLKESGCNLVCIQIGNNPNAAAFLEQFSTLNNARFVRR